MATAVREGSLGGRRGREKRGGGGEKGGEQGQQIEDIFIASVGDEEDDGGRAETLGEKRNALRGFDALKKHGVGDVVGDGGVWERRRRKGGNPELN